MKSRWSHRVIGLCGLFGCALSSLPGCGEDLKLVFTTDAGAVGGSSGAGGGSSGGGAGGMAGLGGTGGMLGGSAGIGGGANAGSAGTTSPDDAGTPDASSDAGDAAVDGST